MYNPYAVMYDAKMTVKRWQDVELDGYTKHKLFCGLDEDVWEGDLVEITLRTGKMVEVTLGECHPYSFQWQCEIKRDDNA